MNICIAGWYFHEPLVQTLTRMRKPHNWLFINHRRSPEFCFEDACVSPGMVRERLILNVGLEFGCYDWYLKNEWEGGSVLFMHDDAEITEAALDAISEMTADQAFLFSSAADAEANGKAHGRAMFCSDKFLTRLKADGGFWYDERPCDGKPIPATTATEPDWHNAAIQVFRAYVESLPQDEIAANRVAIVPGLKTGYRGRL